MKKILAFLFVVSGIAYPCMNEYEEISGVEKHSGAPDGFLNEVYTDQGSLYAYISSNLYLLDGMSKEATDVAIAYAYLKKYDRALDITSRLVKKYPDEYNVVITYAVCLELNGKYEEALTYLRKAITINPSSHWGSEWIHEKILEFVISKKDIQGKSVLELDFGTDSLPVYSGSLPKDSLLNYLEYQLEDRSAFIDTIDPIYGSLLFDYANLLLINDEYYNAENEFEKVKHLGYTHPALQKRIDYCLSLQKKNQKKQEYDYYEIVEGGSSAQYGRYTVLGLSILVVLGSAIGFFVFVRRKR